MKRSTGFNLLREWATEIAVQYGPHGDIEVVEPGFPNAALTVDIELDRSLAQVLLWPTGSLEVRVVAIASGEAVATESHEMLGEDGLTELLAHTQRLLNKTQASR